MYSHGRGGTLTQNGRRLGRQVLVWPFLTTAAGLCRPRGPVRRHGARTAGATRRGVLLILRREEAMRGCMGSFARYAGLHCLSSRRTLVTHTLTSDAGALLSHGPNAYDLNGCHGTIRLSYGLFRPAGLHAGAHCPAANVLPCPGAVACGRALTAGARHGILCKRGCLVQRHARPAHARPSLWPAIFGLLCNNLEACDDCFISCDVSVHIFLTSAA